MLSRERRRVLLEILLVRFFQNAALAVVPPLLPRLSGALGLSPTEAGGVIGAFGAVRLLAELPLGLYLTRVSRASRMVLASVGFTLAGTVLFGVAWSYSLLLVGRALVGIGNGMSLLATQVLFLSLCPQSHVARLFNVSEAVGVGSVVVHGFLGGVIADRWGWRAAFVWAGASVAASGIAAVSGIQAVRRGMPGDGVMEEAMGRPASRPRPFKHGTVYGMVLLTALTLSVAWSGVLTTLIPLYGGNVLRLGSGQIATVLSAAYLLDIALLFPAGRIMDRHSRTILLVPALVILIMGVLLLPQTGTFWTYLGVSMFFASGLVTWHVPETLIADLRLGSRQGFMLALVRVVSDVAFFVAPVMVGYLVEHGGYVAAARAVALFVVGNLLLAMFDVVRRRGRLPLRTARARTNGISEPFPEERDP